MRRVRRIVGESFWLLTAAAIVLGGFYGFRLLGGNAPEVEATPVVRPVASVDTVPLTPIDGPIPIRGTGFIEPFRQVALAAEQGGRIIGLHPAIENHGQFEAGEVLVRLDDSAARARLTQTEANVATTRIRRDLVATQLDRTRRLFERGVAARDLLDDLEAQLAELDATIVSLEAAREVAVIDLENTQVRAPFAGAVLERRVETGTVVAAGQALADLYTPGLLEVTVPVREEEAALIPGLFANKAASARVTTRFAGEDIAWRAGVERVDRALDPRTRSLNVTLRLQERLERPGETPASGLPPPLVNAFVRVVIDGAEPGDTFAVPSTAVHRNGAEIRLAVDGRLALHPAELLHVDGEISFVRLTDLPEGARLIVSPLDAPVENMPIEDLGRTGNMRAALEVTQ